MARKKQNDELLHEIARSVIDYVFQNKGKFKVFDGTVLKVTNREIRQIIESKYGPDIWNYLPLSAKFYDILKQECWRRNHIAVRMPLKTRTGRWRLYIIPSDKTSEFVHLLR